MSSAMKTTVSVIAKVPNAFSCTAIGIEEDHLDVEEDEEHRDQVERDAEAEALLDLRGQAALVRARVDRDAVRCAWARADALTAANTPPTVAPRTTKTMAGRYERQHAVTGYITAWAEFVTRCYFVQERREMTGVHVVVGGRSRWCSAAVAGGVGRVVAGGRASRARASGRCCARRRRRVVLQAADRRAAARARPRRARLPARPLRRAADRGHVLRRAAADRRRRPGARPARPRATPRPSAALDEAGQRSVVMAIVRREVAVMAIAAGRLRAAAAARLGDGRS